MTVKGYADRFPFVEAAALRRAAVVCHRNADADAYLSAYAVMKLIGALAPECSVDVATPGGMTVLTTKLARSFRASVLEESDKDYDLYVAVDVGDAELLQAWREKMSKSSATRVLVDHHPRRESAVYDHEIVDEKATSAAEVVWGLFKELKVPVDPSTAQALLEGILFDSSHLAIAGPASLRAAVDLIDAGADLEEARRALRSEPDYGEVIAKLKGAQRLRIYRLGQWVAAVSRVGSFQAHMARSAISLGADVAVIGGETEGETRVSLRASQRFLDKTGVELGRQVAETVGAQLGGHGGGHGTAASLSCHETEEVAIEAALGRVAALLGSKPEEVT